MLLIQLPRGVAGPPSRGRTAVGELLGAGLHPLCPADAGQQHPALLPVVLGAGGGTAEATQDRFHRYVVTEVVEDDRIPGSPDQFTWYDCLGTPAWRYTEDDGLTKQKYKTWGQWRGYGRIRITEGQPNEVRSVTEKLFMRGMYGDKTAGGGTRSVTVCALWTPHQILPRRVPQRGPLLGGSGC